MVGFLLPCLLLLLLRGQRSSACPRLCSCQHDRVDCSGRAFTSASLPTALPAGTSELLLHDNLLTALPDGLLDALASVRSVSLHGNPWACDCGVLRLRAWMLRHAAVLRSHTGVACSSPGSLRGRTVASLAEEEVLESCHYWYCDLALASQVCLLAFVLVQVALLVALVIFLKKFQKLSKEARRTSEEGLAAGEGPRENDYSALKDSGI